MLLRTSFGRTTIMNSEREQFLSAFARAIRSAAGLPVLCPLCGTGHIRFLYVADSETRVGYCDAWCDVCLRGVHVSRAMVPAGIVFTAFSDAKNSELPDFIRLE